MALSAESPRQLRNDANMMWDDVVVANGVTIYPGALCCYIAASGLLTPAADSTTLRFAGLAIGESGDYKPVVGNAGGTTRCRVIYRNAEALVPCAATVDAGDIGTELYCFDDGSVTDVATLGPIAGVMRAVETSGVSCWVEIGGRAMPLGT